MDVDQGIRYGTALLNGASLFTEPSSGEEGVSRHEIACGNSGEVNGVAILKNSTS